MHGVVSRKSGTFVCAMASKFSIELQACGDHSRRQKSIVYYGRHFGKVSELALSFLKQVLPAEYTERVNRNNVRKKCYKMFYSQIEEHQRRQKASLSSLFSPYLDPADTSFIDEKNLVRGIAEAIERCRNKSDTTETPFWRKRTQTCWLC